MNIAMQLLKANHVGVRELKMHLSGFLKKGQPFIITEHGRPMQVMIPYADMLEFVDIIEELQDPEVLKLIQQGRKSIKRGAKGLLVSKIFQKIRAAR